MLQGQGGAGAAMFRMNGQACAPAKPALPPSLAVVCPARGHKCRGVMDGEERFIFIAMRVYFSEANTLSAALKVYSISSELCAADINPAS